MTYVLGVDGGNSKTLAAVADGSGRVLGVGRAGCGNHQAYGLEILTDHVRVGELRSHAVAGAMREIRSAAEEALRVAGVSVEDVDLAYFALAGADLPEDFEALTPALVRSGLARQVRLNNDTIAALRSGADNPNAVVVLMGAGTNAAGRNAGGEEIRLPGLGWYSGDWGGGGDLGREAVWFSVRAYDGRGPHTLLQDMILDHLGVQDIPTLIHRLYHREIDRSRSYTLAPLVFDAAELGDEVARGLVIRAGEEVATTATALLRRLDILNCPADVVLGGSIFRARGTLLLDTICNRLLSTAPHARLVVPEIEPVLGAVFCAFDALGIAVEPETRARAGETYQQIVQRSTFNVQRAV